MTNCTICGRVHKELFGAIGYEKPLHYFMVPEPERDSRIRINEDLCDIDGKIFLIRGVVEVPLLDNAEIEGTPWFEWGIWAAVSRTSFIRYLDLFENDAFSEPPFDGLLAGEPLGYEGLIDYPVAIHLRSTSQRPAFRLKESSHIMYIEQQQGISLRRVHDIFAKVRPEMFA